MCNSAWTAALSGWAAAFFSPRFTSYYSLVNVETHPQSRPTEETTSAVKINELWPTLWQERDGWCKGRDWRSKKRGEGQERIWEFSCLKTENEYFQDFLHDIWKQFHSFPPPSFHHSVLRRFHLGVIKLPRWTSLAGRGEEGTTGSLHRWWERRRRRKKEEAGIETNERKNWSPEEEWKDRGAGVGC